VHRPAIEGWFFLQGTQTDNATRYGAMGKTVLIVDDSSIMRKMIKQTLVDDNHIVAGEAKNGKEAIQMYKALKPDVVTMDITMREMDGFEAAREILEVDPNARIIFLSNLDEEKYSVDAKRLGALGYVNKHNAKAIVDLINTM
jgi:two-component system, chemotaxis family, chemotaxis protein CheY